MHRYTGIHAFCFRTRNVEWKSMLTHLVVMANVSAHVQWISLPYLLLTFSFNRYSVICHKRYSVGHVKMTKLPYKNAYEGVFTCQESKPPPLSLSNSLDRTSLSAFTRSCSHAIMFLLRRNGDLFFCPSLTSLDFRLFFQPFILARHGKVWSQVCSSRFRSAALSISQRLLHFFDVNTPWQRRTNRWSEVCFYNRIVQSK